MKKRDRKIKKFYMTKTSLVTIVVAALFVFAYVFIISYTYDNLLETSRSAFLKATVSSTTSFSKVMSSNMSQMDYISHELTEKVRESEESGKELTPGYLSTFLSKKEPTSCVMIAYVSVNGDFYTSTGETGHTDYKQIEERLDKAPLFLTKTNNEGQNKDYGFYYRDIKVNGKLKGRLFGAYNFDKLLKEISDDDIYKDNSINMILSGKGHVYISSATKNAPKFDTTKNFLEFAEQNRFGEKTFLLSDGKKDDRSYVSTLLIDGQKYAAAFSPLPDYADLYIARVIPSRVLFSQTGNLLAFLTVASLCFFFAIVLIAYRYYKTVTETTDKIQSVALMDPLTGFANFSKFKEDAAKMLREDRDSDYYICCADMIGFRYINDAFGYDTGDQILIDITQEIDDLLTEDEIFARISGDKFVILTKRNFYDTDSNLFLYQLTDRISTIQPLSKSHIRLEVQMGVYKIMPGDVDKMSINALYDRCLVALYSIEHVDTGIAIYDASIHNEQIAKKDIESKMHQALQNGEFRVYVQPKYRTSNGRLAAGEALIRWVDPEKGIVPPIKFIPLFEQNRFVHDVDLYVMEVVARFLRMRLNDGLPVVPISLNISPVEITLPGFRNSYIAIKEKYDIPDKLIELEFTEGIFFENEELFKEVILDFQNHGFTCSMDDFGSGYSSLNILKDLPVDTLKLDKLFFRESENTERDRSIIRSVVAMARSLNIKTVAEGVETLDVVEFLKLIGCTLIQGYIYSKPLPLTEFEERLDNENIDKSGDVELDFDKFELVPLDIPLSNSVDNSLRRTYASIMEINTGGNIFHVYHPGGGNARFEALPERGFYTSFINDVFPNYIHPDDVEKVKKNLNSISLSKHFSKNTELDFEYRHIKKDGTYSWVKVHVIRANGGRNDSQIYFAYTTIIDDYKEIEENLESFSNRFTAAYSRFNGAVFELELSSGEVSLIETHSNLLSSVKDIKDYNVLKQFILDNLVHPDDKEKLSSLCSREYLKNYFANIDTMQSLVVEIWAKPSRKVSTYNYYIATFTLQKTRDKVLIAIEDATEKKKEEIALNLQNKINDVAFSNVYEKMTKVYIERDFYQTVYYPGNSSKNMKSSEGKYSLRFKTMLHDTIKDEDKETVSQVLDLPGLSTFYHDNDTSRFKLSFQERASDGSEDYEWKEILVVSVPQEYGQEKLVYLFMRSINEERETEQSLNEYAHRLSYSLAMFDYAYSVDCETEKVEIIGGLRFDSDIFNEENIDYSALTMMVKNTIIAEDDRSAFRRFTYLDELLNYFSNHSATVTKYFSAAEDSVKFIEVTIIYGARENKITIFVRTLDKSLLKNEKLWEISNDEHENDIPEDNHKEVQKEEQEELREEIKNSDDLQENKADNAETEENHVSNSMAALKDLLFGEHN